MTNAVNVASLGSAMSADSSNNVSVTTGNLTFSSTGQRIRGDFSNATIANRLMFQNSTTNSGTVVSALPNGTATSSQLVAVNNSDPTNAQIAQILSNTSEASFRAAAYGTGTGSYLPMTFYTGGSERMRVDTSGNVGIGTSTLYGKLNVNTSSASLVEQVTLNNPDVNGAGSKISFRQGANEFGTITSKFVSGAWQLDLGTNSFDPTITLKSGSVGIGTSSPGSRLDVQATQGVQKLTSTTGTNSVYQQFVNTGGNAYVGLNNSTGADFGNAAYALQIYHAGAYPIVFATNNTERMRIDSSGRVGINTAPAGYIGNEQFMVAGTNTADQFVQTIAHKSTSPSGGCVSFFSFTEAAPNNTLNSYLICNDNTGVQKLNIYSNGTVSNRTGTYNSLSDAKLKENIVDATPKLDKLMQVQVRNYNLIGDDLKQIGFVAQELEQVFPGLVEDVPDFDKDHKLTGESTKMVKTSVLIPILVKALQEQQTIITDLKARIETLEKM